MAVVVKRCIYPVSDHERCSALKPQPKPRRGHARLSWFTLSLALVRPDVAARSISMLSLIRTLPRPQPSLASSRNPNRRRRAVRSLSPSHDGGGGRSMRRRSLDGTEVVLVRLIVAPNAQTKAPEGARNRVFAPHPRPSLVRLAVDPSAVPTSFPISNASPSPTIPSLERKP